MPKRKEPIRCICTVCGAEFMSWATKNPRYCQTCRHEKDREIKLASARRRRQDQEYRELLNERQRIRRKTDPRCKQKERERYARQRQDPEFVEHQKLYSRDYYRKNAERLRANALQKYHTRREEQARRKKAETNADFALQDAAQRGILLECSRMHIRAMRLPCGQRPECFGSPRCPGCPEDANPPSIFRDWKWSIKELL